ncbi:fibrinolytic enzyme, isozyme C-like isoform X2 [Mizuhopecten yessoensis]|uniref:fibrinolytic enzyme, isozyme C-like isoform X2 n=1 Tax=Mizuhopecten yessoensis TaxID=6573 RepID=UPI000B4588C6|nr:fibrinolytic enzyme, isozyme C-like isoform X2 [Mizuhopecten yessoensis]
MMNVLLLICLLLVVESWAVPKAVPAPRHPSEDLINGALAPRHPSEDLIKAAKEVEQLSQDSRIFGGSDGQISENPWQVSIRSWNSHICGGVILDETTVLTAAHCLGNAARTYSIRYGSGALATGYSVSVTSTKLHENYGVGSGGFPNDIAIMKVQAMSFNGNAQPISLTQRSNDDLAEGALCRITGWGNTNGGTSSIPDNLQEAEMSVITDSACEGQWGSNICRSCHVCVYGDGERSACNGDSGGPLVCKNNESDQWELVGVTSWGATNCPPGYPSVYTEVRSYADWINTNK